METTMTDVTTTARPGVPGRLSGWIGLRQQEVSDRVHASGDALCRSQRWTAAYRADRFGLGAREYRDPRFTP
jgi:hypothetical protein